MTIDEMLAMSESLLIYGLLASVACAVLCGLVAAHRRANWVWWSIMGFVFGPFALPFVFFAKPKAKT